MRQAETVSSKPAPEPAVTDELTKEQLEEMAVAFTDAIAKLDATITDASAQRSKFKKELRAVEGKLITINIRNRQTGAK